MSIFSIVLFVCRGWLERESRHGLQQGQNWFLISMLWWQQWKDYVKYVSQLKAGKMCIYALIVILHNLFDQVLYLKDKFTTFYCMWMSNQC